MIIRHKDELVAGLEGELNAIDAVVEEKDAKNNTFVERLADTGDLLKKANARIMCLIHERNTLRANHSEQLSSLEKEHKSLRAILTETTSKLHLVTKALAESEQSHLSLKEQYTQSQKSQHTLIKQVKRAKTSLHLANTKLKEKSVWNPIG